MMSQNHLYRSLCAAVEGNSSLPERFRFDQKELLWVANGIVMREKYTANGESVLVKVEPLITDFVRHKGVYPVNDYSFSNHMLICDGQKYLVENDFRMLRFKQREVQMLDFLANVDTDERFVRRLFCPDTGKDHELFFANGSLYVRSLMKEKKGVCLGDKNNKYATGNESTVELIHPLDIVKLAKDIGESLLLLEQWDIVHRDVKRSNILRNVRMPGKSIYYLVDFGTACFADDKTDEGLLIGTDGYNAPEVIRGEGASNYSDIWGLGAVLYAEMMKDLPFSTVGYRNIDNINLIPLYNRITSNLPLNHNFVDNAVKLLHGDVGVRKRSLDSLLTVVDNILGGKEELYYKQIAVPSCKKKDFNATRQEPLRRESWLVRQAEIKETFRDGELDKVIDPAIFRDDSR